MSRKPVLEGGKRDEIMDAALELFFEKGYDATSIRTIMRKVGSEVGLFYYYFENKDDVFDKAVHRFLAQYEAGMEDIVQRAKRDPFRAMNFFFHYMQKPLKNQGANPLRYDHHWNRRYSSTFRYRMSPITLSSPR